MQAGARVAGYELTRPLGAGAFGAVWEARHPDTGEALAVKSLLPYAAASRDVVRRFRREAALLRRVRSGSVARIVDFVVDESLGMLLLMELVPGESLKAVLSRSTLSVEEAIELGVSILAGVADVHRVGIVHRDIKPSNIMLRPRPDGSHQAVLLDFGLARARPGGADASLSRITESQATLGTVHYMAPEQILNAHSATERSDLYAVGAILHFAVCGRHPFGDVEAAAARRKLSEDPGPLLLERDDARARGLEVVILRAMRRRPMDRFASAQDFMAALEALRRDERTVVLRVGSSPELTQGSTRMSGRKKREALRFWLEVVGFFVLCAVVLVALAAVLPEACK